MMRVARVAGLALLISLVTGCTREVALPLAQTTYVSVMAELRTAATQVGGPGPAFEGRRAEILKRAGVTEAELTAHTKALQRDPEKLRETYDSIAFRLRRAAEPQ